MSENENAASPADEVEGHMPLRKSFTDEAVPDDTEGHAIKARGFTDGATSDEASSPGVTRGRGVTDDEDDVGGHAARGKV